MSPIEATSAAGAAINFQSNPFLAIIQQRITRIRSRKWPLAEQKE